MLTWTDVRTIVTIPSLPFFPSPPPPPFVFLCTLPFPPPPHAIKTSSYHPNL